jgi:hypothetical protein
MLNDGGDFIVSWDGFGRDFHSDFHSIAASPRAAVIFLYFPLFLCALKMAPGGGYKRQKNE